MKIVRIIKVISIIEVVIGILCMAYYGLCAQKFGTGISILYAWLVMGVVLLVKAMLNLLITHQGIRRFLLGLDVLGLMVLVSMLLFAGFVLGDMNEKAPSGCDYVIVLGAAVNGDEPTEILQKRIDAAYEYLVANPNAKVIGTGGRSPEDQLSEGACIAGELEEMGIATERIFYEDRSTTTVENMRFALEVIGQESEPSSPEEAYEQDGAIRIAVVSNGFHIFRAKFILSSYTDYEVYGIAATGGGILTPHYILREYVVFIVDTLRANIF